MSDTKIGAVNQLVDEIWRLRPKARELPNDGGRNILELNALCDGGQGQNRTVDTTIFSRMLYQLSYLAALNALNGVR